MAGRLLQAPRTGGYRIGSSPEAGIQNAQRVAASYGNAGVAGGGVSAPAGVPAVGGGTVTNTTAANPTLQQATSSIRDRIAQQRAKEGVADPRLNQQAGQFQQRLGQLQGREGAINPLQQEQIDNLRKRMSTDTTQRASDFANQQINSGVTAGRASLTQDLARRGIAAGSGVAGELGQRISDTAQRLKAQSAAGLGLQRERDLDALTLGGQGIMNAPEASALARENMANQFQLGGQNIMAAPGQYGLQREQMTNNLLPLELQGAGQVAGNQIAQQGLNLNQWQAQNSSALQQQEMSLRQQEMAEAQKRAMAQVYANLF